MSGLPFADNQRDTKQLVPWLRLGPKLAWEKVRRNGCLSAFFVSVVAVPALIHMVLLCNTMCYFLDADPTANVQIDKVAWQFRNPFENSKTVLFHTSNATMQKVIKHYGYKHDPNLCTAPMSSLSVLDIKLAGWGRYREIGVKPANRYFSSGMVAFELYWDTNTETGCLEETFSD